MCPVENEMTLPLMEPIKFPERYVFKLIKCAKCGCELQVGERVVMAFCRDCSATLGVKR